MYQQLKSRRPKYQINKKSLKATHIIKQSEVMFIRTVSKKLSCFYLG